MWQNVAWADMGWYGLAWAGMGGHGLAWAGTGGHGLAWANTLKCPCQKRKRIIYAHASLEINLIKVCYNNSKFWLAWAKYNKD